MLKIYQNSLGPHDTYVLETKIKSMGEVLTVQNIFCEGLWVNKGIKPSAKLWGNLQFILKLLLPVNVRFRLSHIGQRENALFIFEVISLKQVFNTGRTVLFILGWQLMGKNL